VTSFGKSGFLPNIRPTSPPMIYRNTLMSQGDREEGKGLTIKGFDIVTGEQSWAFYLKAQPGDPNRASWLDGSAESNATPDIWGMFTVDADRGILYIPVEKVGNDYWGGSNHGNILYADSLPRSTRRWQDEVVPALVHHDIWDYDLRAAHVRRGQQKRSAHPGHRPGDEDGVAVLPEPPDRRADLRDRRAEGAADQRARRMEFSDAAVPGQAAAAGAQCAETVRAVEGHARAPGFLRGPVE
jgi:hypothetical protein